MANAFTLALFCFVVIQVAIETVAFEKEHIDDCHDNDITLNCPPFAKIKPGAESVEMTWQFRVKSTKRWRTIAKIANGKAGKTANHTHLKGRLSIHKNGSLGIRALKDEDENLYRCQVKKNAGKREIHVVEVNLTCSGLKVTKRQVCVEEDVVLECKPTHKNDAAQHGHVTWHKKNTFKNKLSWSVISNADTIKDGHNLYGNGSLWIRGGRTKGEKVYRCVVAKSLKHSREMHLTVVTDVICRREKRQIEGLHQVISVCIGDSIRLPCSTLQHINTSTIMALKWRVRRSASPKHFQQLAHSKPQTLSNQTIFVNEGFTHNSTRLHDSNINSVNLGSNGSLLIQSIRLVDEGDFECIVKTKHHHEPTRQTLHVKVVDCNKTGENDQRVDHVKPTSLATQASNKTTKVAMTTGPPMTTVSRIKSNDSLGLNDTRNHVTDKGRDVDGKHSGPFSAPATVSNDQAEYKRTLQSAINARNTTTSSPQNITDTTGAIEARTWNVVKQLTGVPGFKTTIVTTVTTSISAIHKREEVTSKEDQSRDDVTPTGSKPNCGGNLAGVTGGFQSPNFPSAYPANSYCKWIISVPQDYAAIEITVEQMNLEYETNCLHDWIAIYDELGNQVGNRRCGVSDGSPINVKIRGSLARVEFKADDSVQKTGFKLIYQGARPSG